MSSASVFDLPTWAKADATDAKTAPPAVLCMTMNQDASVMLAGTSEGFIVYSMELAQPFATGYPSGPTAASGTAGGGAAFGTANSSVGNSREDSSDSSIFSTQWQEQASRVSSAMQELCRRTFYGGVGRVAMCERSSMLLLSGASPETSLTVTLWDDGLYDEKAAARHCSERQTAAASRQKQNSKAQSDPQATPGEERAALPTTTIPYQPPHILASIDYDVPIRTLRLNPFCIIIADTVSVSVYNRHLDLSGRFDTVWTKGFSQNNSNTVDAGLRTFAKVETGYEDIKAIDIMCLGPTVGSLRLLEFVVAASSRSKNIDAASLIHKATERNLRSLHNSHIHTLAIASAARIGATVSEGGTAIKIIDIARGVELRQLMRGKTKNLVPTLILSPRGDFCMCVSESGTLHCFATSDTVHLANPSSSSGHSANNRSVTNREQSSATAAAVDHMDAFGGFAPGGANKNTAANQIGGRGAAAAPPSSTYLGSFFGAGSGSGPSSSSYLPQRYQDAVKYMASHSSFASASLLDDGDVEAFSHGYDYDCSTSASNGVSVPLTAAFCCAALRPECEGRYRVVVSIGGLSSQSKARCLHVDLDAAAARRVATFIFPRDLL